MSDTPTFKPDQIPDMLRAEVEQQWHTFSKLEGGRSIDARKQQAMAVWACSPFAARTCLTCPDVLLDLVASGDLDRVYADAELRTRVSAQLTSIDNDDGMQKSLRELRRREMLRIAWRDISGAALSETLNDLSILADVCIEQAINWSYTHLGHKYGTPRDHNGAVQRLVVLGMGKLGGGELNFSSDIDLIFAYPEDGQTDGDRTLDNQGFFVKVVQHLIKMLAEITADGQVFRVDARLRPFGDSGPMTASFDAMEDYYQTHGRDWERYALIKARVITCDPASGDELLKRLRPFVYRRYLDYGAFEALRSMKALVDAEVSRKRMQNNIKLGPGGIREIEFIGQAFQLIRGGQDRELQQRSIQTILGLLAEREHLPAASIAKLQAAYEFLRRAENRLQMLADQQTHSLPEDDLQRARIAFGMGHENWGAFSKQLEAHRAEVQQQFNSVFMAPEDEPGEPHNAKLWNTLDDEQTAIEELGNAGYTSPGKALDLLLQFRQTRIYTSLTGQARERMDRFMPLLIAATGYHPGADQTLPRVLHLVEAVARRSVYLVLLTENPQALTQLIKLSAASRWLADYLSKHPVLLDELLDTGALYSPPDLAGLAAQLATEMQQVDPADEEQQLNRLRNFKHASVLSVAAADVMEALPLMRVSDQLTWIAEAILDYVLNLATAQITARHGRPTCVIDGTPHTPGFAIIAYGKLGGIELGYGSDLDLVFIHDSAGEAQRSSGAKPLDNTEFFARLAQRIIHIVSTFTTAGELYEIDPRLRPSGTSGLLVSSLRTFGEYQEQEAWTWEHQALVRARPVCGDPRIAAAFQQVRADILQRKRDPVQLRADVREMRAKMWKALGSGNTEHFDLKKDPGGIGDIEFMVQYAVLAHAHAFPSIVEYTDNIRIMDSLEACGLMPRQQADKLRDIYRAYRDKVHALDLQDQAATVSADEFADYRSVVQQYWQDMLVD